MSEITRTLVLLTGENPFAEFTDARGLSDSEMQDLARETSLQETTFVFRVLRRLHLASQKPSSAQTSDASEISLDLKVGKIPVHFRTEPSGSIFGEMRQVDPLFSAVHDRSTIAGLLDLSPEDISSDAPIQTLSTGLFFLIVPIKNLMSSSV